jgi:hypothetical protein
VAGILKHAPDLPDVATRVKACKDAIRYAYPRSELEKQAKHNLKELQSARPV